jgi:hypothetical protein
MDKDVKDLLDWFEDKESDASTLWGLAKNINDPRQDKVKNDKATLLKIFNEEQLRLIKILLNDVLSALAFHRDEDDSAHPNIRDKLSNVDAKLRNHRHNLDQTYSAKAEF